MPLTTRQFEHFLHDVLRLRPRNQHIRSHFKIQSPKFLMAGDVLGGFAGGPFRDELRVALQGLGRYLVIRMTVKISAITPQNVHQQQFRGELCGRHLTSKKGLEPLPKCSAKRWHSKTTTSLMPWLSPPATTTWSPPSSCASSCPAQP